MKITDPEIIEAMEFIKSQHNGEMPYKFSAFECAKMMGKYHKAKTLNKEGCPKCGYPEIVSSIDSFDSSCPNCGNEWKTK